MVTTSCALGLVGTDSPAATARPTSSTSASPRRWSEGRRSRSPSTGFGAESGPSAASRTAFPSTSSDSRYSKTPMPVSCGWDRAMNRFPASCSACSCPSSPYRASSAGRTIRHPRGPCCSAMPISPSSTWGSAPSASSGRSRSASTTTTAAERTGSRPVSTASFTGALAALPNACASETTCCAPPARVEGAWWRTHCVRVIAAEPPDVSPRHIASPTTATRAASQARPSSSTSPSSPASPAGPSPDGACHSAASKPRSASRAAAIRSRRCSRLRLPSMTTTIEASTDNLRGSVISELHCPAYEFVCTTAEKSQALAPVLWTV